MFSVLRVTNEYNFKCQGPHMKITDKDKPDLVLSEQGQIMAPSGEE